MESDKLKSVQLAISEPRLARNRRGKVIAALNCLPRTEQGLLACDFVEHAIPLFWADINERMELYRIGVMTVRGFLNGTMTVHDVKRYNSQLYSDLEAVQVCDSTTITNYHLPLQWGPLYLLIRCCCDRKMAEAGLIYPQGKQHSMSDVVRELSAEVAKHAGGADWDSLDAGLRDVARKRGKNVADEFEDWELRRILEFARN